MIVKLGDWHKAGAWDAEHGLMPMSLGVFAKLPREVARVYAEGYRRALTGAATGVNRYTSAER